MSFFEYFKSLSSRIFSIILQSLHSCYITYYINKTNTTFYIILNNPNVYYMILIIYIIISIIILNDVEKLSPVIPASLKSEGAE